MKMPSEKTDISFKVTLDRFEEQSAVLLTEKGDEIVLSKKLLPKAISEGDCAVITIETEEAETLRRETTAKELLNELLNAK